MKKCMLLLVGVLSMAVCTSAFASDERPITVSELPASARQFIQTHFGSAQVSYATVDGKLFDKEYKVVFADGRKVEFAKNGEWKEVEAGRADFPMSVLPQAIRSYLHEHYPDAAVEQIDRDRYGYEVKLRNGLELEFDKNGRLYKIDD